MARLLKVVIVFSYSGPVGQLNRIVGRSMSVYNTSLRDHNLTIEGFRGKLNNTSDDIWEIYPKIVSENSLTESELLEISDTVADFLISEVDRVGGVVIRVKRLV